jgi:hypothetical protein
MMNVRCHHQYRHISNRGYPPPQGHQAKRSGCSSSTLLHIPHTLLLYLCFLHPLHILPILTSPPPHSPLIIILRFLLLLRILLFILLFFPRLLLLLFRQRFLLRRRTNTRTS